MSSDPIRVCVAGATGWTGRAVAQGVLESRDLVLASAVARRSSGEDLGTAWAGEPIGVPVHGSVDEALDGVDVLVDYTSHTVVREHAILALERCVSVVVGSSGLTAEDLAKLGSRAEANGVGIFAGGNFSLTATLMAMAAQLVAEHLPDWEIIDYARADKPDSPSGTSRELAERLGELRAASSVALDGSPARGMPIGGTRVHSVRLPSYELRTEIVFGLPDERLTISHESGFQAEKFVEGTLMAVRSVRKSTGLTRGLDTLLGS